MSISNAFPHSNSITCFRTVSRMLLPVHTWWKYQGANDYLCTVPGAFLVARNIIIWGLQVPTPPLPFSSHRHGTCRHNLLNHCTLQSGEKMDRTHTSLYTCYHHYIRIANSQHHLQSKECFIIYAKPVVLLLNSVCTVYHSSITSSEIFRTTSYSCHHTDRSSVGNSPPTLRGYLMVLTSSSLSFCSIMTVENPRSGVFPEEEDETETENLTPVSRTWVSHQTDRRTNPLQVQMCTKRLPERVLKGTTKYANSSSILQTITWQGWGKA